MSFRLALTGLLGVLLVLTFPARAQAPAADDAQQVDTDELPETQGTVTFTEGAIDREAPSQADDREIEARLSSIFAALPAFDGVEVEVINGVVRLSGEAGSRETVLEAEALASRLSGVVAVNNHLVTDVSVERRLGPAADRMRQLARDTIALLPLLVVALLIVLVFWLAGQFLGRQAWLWRRLAANALVAGLLRTIIPVIFATLGLVIALNILDAVAVLSAVLGAAGVLGLAVGFAVRDSIENFIASVLLSIRQPFRSNDYVDIDGRTGNVVRLTSRATILMTPDGNHLRIPNAQVFKAVITNYTRNPERRFTFDLGIDAEDDPQAAMETGLARLRSLDFILDRPAPLAWIVEVGDSNILLTFGAWIDQETADFLKSKSAAIRVVKADLEANGFTLPEPIYRIRIDQMPELGSLPARPATPAPTPAPAKKPAEQLPVDVAPDRSIEEKVAEDRRDAGETDLLSEAAPTEFGDEGQPPSGGRP